MKLNELDSPRSESGMTILEMLVAMLIATIILAGLVTIFASMRRSFSTTRALNQLVNQQQFASTVLTNAISSAGYYPASNRTIRGQYPTAETAFPAVSTISLGGQSIRYDTAGQFVYGTGGTASNDNDVVAVRMLNDSTSQGPFDCLGSAGSGTGILYSVFWVNTAKHQLMCATNTYKNGQPLLGGDLLTGPGLPAGKYGGVKYLRAEYGVDTNRDGSVDRFMSANTLNTTAGQICPDILTGTGNTSSCWPYVRSVQFTLGFITSLNDAKSPVYVTRTVRLNNTNGMTLNSMSNVVVGN